MKRFFLSVTMAIAALSVSSQAKYVFYMIGDGMGLGHATISNYYNKQVNNADDDLLMLTFPHTAIAATHSMSDFITDSAASGTALSTGTKTNNGMVGLANDSTTELRSIAHRLKDDGWGVAIISSGATDDATPAAFYAHQLNRGMTYDIAMDGTKSGYDFIGGSGLHALVRDGKVSDILDKYKEAGFDVALGASNAVVGKSKQMLVISENPSWTLGYAIDHPQGTKLEQLVALGMEQLEINSPERFFMMIEEGDIDHAGHSCDGGAIIHQTIDFQKSIQLAYDFYLQHPDETLIVVTADHDTSGSTFGYRKGDAGLISCQKMSKSAFGGYCRKLYESGENVSWEDMKEILRENLGFWDKIQLKDKDAKRLQSQFERMFKARQASDEKGLYESFDTFVVDVYNTFGRYAGLEYVIGGHTGNAVPVYAIGKGAELFKGFIDNTDIPRLIMTAVE